MDDLTLSEQLRHLGLSEKEVDTYLAILEQGEATASEIADATGVSKRYVYSISEALEDRGFVDVDDHVVPTKIWARPPEEVVAALTDELAAMEPALSERYSRAERDLQQFDVVKSRVTVVKRIAEFISAADSELTLSIPYEHLSEVADELREAVDRGVLALVLVNDAPSNGFDTDDVDGVATVVRTWEHATPLILTVDQQYGVVAPVEMVARSNTDQRAIAFAQEQIVPVLVGSFMGNYWPTADEVYVAEPRSLPAAYRSFRHAVLDATLRLREDRPVGVEASVTPSRGGPDHKTLTGTVVDTYQGLVEPATNDFPVQNSLVAETDDGRVTVGGPGSFLEDFEATEVTLTARE
ncbi:TrmB family transcriptional regulator sugar-binding domain-containing protein [Halorussus amylolyticus]|uniref:TrmB family transcriptional regulator sugar-binding domain-containing protein n=1 Tax=Halorussus amylolyticus TaxID=1126242 RepID=UPI00104A29E9|nr:TrmB family transcriptional regulator sugar-binding domain-containing protein [Halorussus amylolyticus]